MSVEKREISWNGISIMRQEDGNIHFFLLFNNFETGARELQSLLQINAAPVLLIDRLEDGTHDIFIGFNEDVFMKGNFGQTVENYPNIELMRGDDINVTVIAGAKDGDIVMGSKLQFTPINVAYNAN